MKYLKSYEVYAQDMMAIPTNISDNMVQIKEKLQPYYDYIKKRNLLFKNVSMIDYEQIDKYYGFSFLAFYTKIYILTDKKDIFILVNEQLIPMTSTSEIIKILESEA